MVDTQPLFLYFSDIMGKLRIIWKHEVRRTKQIARHLIQDQKVKLEPKKKDASGSIKFEQPLKMHAQLQLKGFMGKSKSAQKNRLGQHTGHSSRFSAGLGFRCQQSTIEELRIYAFRNEMHSAYYIHRYEHSSIPESLNS